MATYAPTNWPIIEFARAADHKIVAVDHLGAAADAENDQTSGDERPLIFSASSAS